MLNNFQRFGDARRSRREYPMAENAAGFVVVGKDGRFLSRKDRWVRHQNRGSCPGIRRAWVHPADHLLAGGSWAEDADLVVPAAYDPETLFTVVAGNSVPFRQFVLASGGQV